MLTSITIFAAFLNRPAHRFAAILGGIGFGFFIDEIGKFITHDNNYFWEPATSIIYVILICLYLIFRFLDKNRTLTKKEDVLNALQITEDLALYQKNPGEKRLAIQLLKKAGFKEPFAKDLMSMLRKFRPISTDNKDLIDKTVDKSAKLYRKFIENKYFTTYVIIAFVSATLYNLLSLYVTLTPIFKKPAASLGFSQSTEILSSSISALLILAGSILIFKNRLQGYKLYKTSLLISIFLTQVFTFYRDQLAAITTLALNIFFLGIIRYLIKKEKGQP